MIYYIKIRNPEVDINKLNIITIEVLDNFNVYEEVKFFIKVLGYYCQGKFIYFDTECHITNVRSYYSILKNLVTIFLRNKNLNELLDGTYLQDSL